MKELVLSVYKRASFWHAQCYYQYIISKSFMQIKDKKGFMQVSTNPFLDDN